MHLPRTAKDAFERLEGAESAMRKLFFDEALSEVELNDLLTSDYLMPVGEFGNDVTGSVSCLYKPAPLKLALTSPILFSSVEREILAYFGRHPELMFSLPPRKFEELVASIFRQNGFEVELTPESRDGGIDIIAVRNDKLAGQELHLIECKRYLPNNTVGIGIVQRLLGVVEQHRATKGIVVTTSSFSKDARVVAESTRHRLELSEYKNVSAWLATFAQYADGTV
jgi:restriction system protein